MNLRTWRRKSFFQDFIESIELHPDRLDGGSIVKQVNFMLTMSYKGVESMAIRLYDEKTVETVSLLPNLNTKQHTEDDIQKDEFEFIDAEKEATYSEIKEYVLKHTGLKVSSLFIVQVKQKCGIIERENHNNPKYEDSRQPQCLPDK